MYLGETQLSVARCILLESIYLDRTIAIRHSKFVGSKVKQWATNGSLKRAMDWQTGRVKGKRKSWPAFLVAGQTFGEGCWIQHCDSVLLASHEKRSQKLGKYLTHARSERGKGETEGKRDLTETDWKYNERERESLPQRVDRIYSQWLQLSHTTRPSPLIRLVVWWKKIYIKYKKKKKPRRNYFSSAFWQLDSWGRKRTCGL